MGLLDVLTMASIFTMQNVSLQARSDGFTITWMSFEKLSKGGQSLLFLIMGKAAKGLIGGWQVNVCSNHDICQYYYLLIWLPPPPLQENLENLHIPYEGTNSFNRAAIKITKTNETQNFIRQICQMSM